MGSYDDNSGNSPIPGGSLAKPVLIALGALLIGKMLKGNSEETEATQAQPVPVPDQSQAGGGLLGGILGGLGGLLGGAAAEMPQQLPRLRVHWAAVLAASLIS